MLHSEKTPAYFHVYDAKPALLAACEDFSNEINTRIRNRIQLRHTHNEIIRVKALEPSYSIGRINDSNFNLLDRFDLAIESRFWKSKQDFLDNGFGFTVNDAAGEPVSVCYAASVVDNIAEIDVATLEKERGKGLASAVVAAFVAYCHENRITANWDCFEDNVPSLMTAKSMGFILEKEYNFLSIFKKGKK